MGLFDRMFNRGPNSNPPSRRLNSHDIRVEWKRDNTLKITFLQDMIVSKNDTLTIATTFEANIIPGIVYGPGVNRNGD